MAKPKPISNQSIPNAARSLRVQVTMTTPKPIPHQSIRNATRSLRVEGWLTEGEALCLYSLAAKATAPIVEIGTFCGLSAMYLAAPGRQPVVTVDPHDTELMNPTQRSMLAGRSSLELAKDYLTGIGCVDRVTLAVGTSQTVDLPDEIGLAFVDGNHHDEAVLADCQAIADRVVQGGFLCFHDWLATGDEATPWNVAATVKAYLQDHQAGWMLVNVIDGLAVWQRQVADSKPAHDAESDPPDGPER